jgi:xylose isomerase
MTEYVMNEKIKVIAERCNWYDWTEDDNWINVNANMCGYFIGKDLEQFAKEIVRECISIYDCVDNGNTVKGTTHYTTALGRTFLDDN